MSPCTVFLITIMAAGHYIVTVRSNTPKWKTFSWISHRFPWSSSRLAFMLVIIYWCQRPWFLKSRSGYCAQCSSTPAQKTSHQVCNHQGSAYGADVVTDRYVDPAAPCRVWAVCSCLLLVMVSWKCVDPLVACTVSAVAVGSHAVMTCPWREEGLVL